MAKQFDTRPSVAGTDLATRSVNLRPAWSVVGWVYLVSHLFFAEVAGLAYIYLPHAWVESPPGVLPVPSNLVYRALFGLWSHWDGQWYLTIAQHGYRTPTATAFFPLYPLSIHLLGASTTIGGIFVSWAAMAVACWMLYKLTIVDFGPRVAWFTVIAFSFFPTAFYTQAVYSEALFLALAISAMYTLRVGRYWSAGILGGFALLVSMYGILLAVPLVWVIFRRHGPQLRRFWPAAVIPLGLILYMVYLTPLFHYPLVFEQAQSNWGRQFAFFWQTLWQGVVTAYQSVPIALSPAALFHGGIPQPVAMNFYNFWFAVYGIVVLVASLRWMPTYLWLYGGLALLVPLTYPAQGVPLMSVPRLLLEAFPVFIATGILLDRYPRLRVTYFSVSLTLGALFVSLFATSHWVA